MISIPAEYLEQIYQFCEVSKTSSFICTKTSTVSKQKWLRWSMQIRLALICCDIYLKNGKKIHNQNKRKWKCTKK